MPCHSFKTYTWFKTFRKMKNSRTIPFSLLLTGCLFVALPAAAQLSGSVKDTEAGKGVPYAMVRVMADGDSVLVVEALCDSTGYFFIENQANPGRALRLEARAMGYAPGSLRVASPAEDIVIMLAPDTASALDEAVVTASRVQFSAEGFSYRLAGDKRMEAKSVVDGLALLPGIVKQQGALKVNGQDVAEYYINGRKVSDTKEVETLLATNVEEVKVQYNPSDNREASLTGAIIYLTLKKPQRGYYGQAGVDLSIDGLFRDGNGGVSGMIFYGVGKWSIYDYLSAATVFGKPRAFSATYATDGSYGEERYTTIHDNRAAYLSNAFSASYELTERSRLMFYDNLSLSGQWARAEMLLVYPHRRARETMFSSPIQALSNDMAAQFNHSGYGELELRAEWLTNRGNNHWSEEYRRLSDDVPDVLTAWQKVHVRNGYDLVRLRAEYAFAPLKEYLKIKVGGSMNWILRRRRFIDYLQGGSADLPNILQPDYHARSTQPYAFLTLSGRAGRFSYSGGVNVQQNRNSYTEDGSPKYTNKDTGVNPRLSLHWKIDEQGRHSLNFSYQRRMGDVPYSAISLSKGWQDATHYTTGNLDLKAARSDNFSLTASLWNGKLSLRTGFFHSSNDIFWETSRDADGNFCTRPVNGKGGNALSFTETLQLQPVKDRWQMTLYTSQQFLFEDAIIGGYHYNRNRFRHYYSISNNLFLQHNWQLRFGGHFEPSFTMTNVEYRRVFQVYAGVTKSWKGGKYQWRFDIYGHRRRSTYTRNPDYVQVYRNRDAVCFVQTSFTWTFSGGKSVNIKRGEGELYYQNTGPRM